MAVCVSQTVITIPANNVTGGIEESEQSMTTGGDLMPECGRLVFRGVELAYLNINGKKMLPLAEMLALVFRSTPRTTLFTRMEKIKAQRYFCQPLEIKMLKKVNGIHGSSANCTLIPEEDVERYCSIYMDRNSDGLACSTGPRELGEVARTDEQIKAVETSDNANAGKESEVATHRGKPANFVIRATDFGVREINTTENSRHTQAVSNKGERKSDADNDGGGNLTSPLSPDQEHTSNGTQTVSMLSWSTKKQAANTVDDLEVNKNAKTKRTKKRKRAVGAGKQEDHKFNSPSDEHKQFPGKGEISQRSTSAAGKSPKLRKRRNLTLNLDSGFSDDSGFTSLTFEDYISPSKVQKLGPQAKLKMDEASPLGPKNQRKKKKKKNCLGLTEDLNLSPPPLVIKKLQNTWQVETKLDSVKKALYKPAKGDKNCQPVNGVLGKHLSTKAQSMKKKKQQRKLVKSGTGAQSTAAASNNQGKKSRPRNGAADACASEAAVIPEEEFLTTPERKKKVSKNGTKKIKVGGRLENLDKTSASQAMTQGSSPSSVSKPLKHAAPSGTKLTPVKPPVLKATPNFSFMSLFPSMCEMVVRDGDLCPEFTMACPSDVAKPHASHPIWKWRLGGPVIAKTHRVGFRIRKIKQPNLKNKPAVADGSQVKSSGSSKTAPSP